MNDDKPTLWALQEEDAWAVDTLTEFVSSLIDVESRDCRALQGLAKLLLGLRRLPAFTPDISLTLSISLTVNGEVAYYSLEFTEEWLQVGEGGIIPSPVGGDTYSREVLTLWLSGGKDGDEYGLGHWIEEAKELLASGAKVSVEDLLEDSEIDWDESVGPEAWRALSSRKQ